MDSLFLDNRRRRTPTLVGAVPERPRRHRQCCIASVAGIIVGAFLLAWILQIVIRRVVQAHRQRREEQGERRRHPGARALAARVDPPRAAHADARARSCRTSSTSSIVIIALLLIVNLLAPSALGSLTLLTAAIGAGLGFGAQNIVKDVLNGIFIVAEDQVGIGDVVDLGLATGIVEYVSVRITHVRDVNGTLWYVRNGEITRIGNMSHGLVAGDRRPRPCPSDADIDEVENTMLETVKDLAKDPKWRTRIIEQARGVGPGVGLRRRAGHPARHEDARRTRRTTSRRELRMRVLHAVERARPGAPAAQLDRPQRARRARSGCAARTRPRRSRPPVTQPPPPPERPVWRPKKTPKSPPETPEGSA